MWRRMTLVDKALHDDDVNVVVNDDDDVDDADGELDDDAPM